MSAAKRFAPNPERREALEKMRAFMQTLADGARVGRVDIQKVTGVTMDASGDEMWRLTASRLKRPMLAIVGYGWEMSAASNSEDIAGARNRRVLNAVDAARDTVDTLLARHGDEMNSDQLARMTHNQSLLGTLSLSSSLAKKLPPKK